MDFNNSRLQQYLTCPRSYLHRYLRKMVSVKRPTYFVFGTAIHKFVEMFYRTKDAKLALRQVEQIFDAVDRGPLNREETHDLECDKNTALGIAMAYPLFYKADFDTYKNFLTEQKFSFPIGKDGDSYFGTLDALLQDHAGDWWILETKTAAAQSISADYFERVKIDSQVAGYMHGAKHILGVFPRGIIYNVIKKPSIRLKNGESLAAFQKRVYEEYTKLAVEKNYFMREELMVAQHRLESWQQNTANLIAELKAKISGKDSGMFFMNTGACRANFGSCMFLPACISKEYSPLIYTKDTENK